jgi:apolipoprotein N-acyltransferase
MADLGGMWLVVCWVMYFNVLVYLIFRWHGYEFASKQFLYSILKMIGVMILPALLYSGYSYQKYAANTGQAIQVSIVPTQYTAQELMDPNLQKLIIEKTLHRNDSLAFEQINRNATSDLYVWPEAGTSNWMNFPNITSILMQATNDWNGSLITGCKGVVAGEDDQRKYISGVMISPSQDSTKLPLQYHHKTNLIAGTEFVPYKEILGPVFYDKEKQAERYFMHGKSFQPLLLKTKNDEEYHVGVSLCYEQWFPNTWAKQTVNGAEFFVHIAAENWYGEVGYQQFMLNVNRFRAIESRRAVARCSNRGVSTFINAVGETYEELPLASLDMATSVVSARKQLSFFSRYPNLFPMVSLVLVLTAIVLSLFDIFIVPKQIKNYL